MVSLIVIFNRIMGSLHFFGEHFAFVDLAYRLELAAHRVLLAMALCPSTLRDSIKGCLSAKC